MNVFIITYSDAMDELVQSQIYDTISEYFLNFNRLDRVPKSDLVTRISSIKEIHSVEINFISKKNEDFHRQAILEQKNRQSNLNNTFSTTETTNSNPDYNPLIYVGLDPVLGDIIFEPSEIPVIRGGWYDRNNTYFSNHLEDGGLKSVNIIKKGTIDLKFRQTI